MKVVAFVPAKGSSERIENKNAKLLDGRPLVVHMLDTLLKCQRIDEVYLDTESDDIAALARVVDNNSESRRLFCRGDYAEKDTSPSTTGSRHSAAPDATIPQAQAATAGVPLPARRPSGLGERAR